MRTLQMSFYDALKDAISVAQKADNVELYRQLLDLGAQALELQAEVSRLKEENAVLKKKHDLSSLLQRHKELFITKEGEEPVLRYCSHCWDSNEKVIQLLCDEEDGTFICPHCKMRGIYDFEKYNAKYREELDDSESDSYFGW